MAPGQPRQSVETIVSRSTSPIHMLGPGADLMKTIPIKHESTEPFTVPIRPTVRRPRGGAWLDLGRALDIAEGVGRVEL
jgi:hypothetical protein